MPRLEGAYNRGLLHVAPSPLQVATTTTAVNNYPGYIIRATELRRTRASTTLLLGSHVCDARNK